MRIRWAIATLGVIALAALTITTQMPWLVEEHPEMVSEAPIAGVSDNSTPVLSCPADAKPANLDFTLKDVDGRDVSLASYKGKVIVLDFWATWCGPCQVSAPIVNSVSQRYRDKGLVVVGVNVDDDVFPVERFVRKKGLTFPIVFDDGKTISRDYGASTLPTLVVVSKEGKIVAVRHGVTSESDLDGLIRRVL